MGGPTLSLIVQPLLLLLVAVVAILDGVRIVVGKQDMVGAREGGGYVVLLGLILACLAVAYASQLRKPVTRPGFHWKAQTGIHWVPIGFAILAGYILLIDHLGYPLSTLLFFITYLRVFGAYRWVPIIGGSLAVAVALTLLWSALGMVLPRGPLPWP